MAFKDHFSKLAGDYAKYRPHYPVELFAYLAAQVPVHDYAWDCATGNGQAALTLTRHFNRVIATDASARQIMQAKPHKQITYVVTPGEQAPIASHTMDLITVAQALHWFNLDLFYAEVKRVLKPEGALAVWCYDLLRISPEIDAVLHDFNENIIGPCWPPERYWVGNHYADLPFPFLEQKAPTFQMEARWRLGDLLGYLGTWSSTQAYLAQHRADPVAQIAPKLAQLWGEGQKTKKICWPLYVRIGRAPRI
ncbi:class I SAM-dependent methyltransferase [candidate division KSB1 bacterium]|nr:MAG: class I SAM-dependent methyltransferase [candidate division KSB1 bacterium]